MRETWGTSLVMSNVLEETLSTLTNCLRHQDNSPALLTENLASKFNGRAAVSGTVDPISIAAAFTDNCTLELGNLFRQVTGYCIASHVPLGLW